VNYNNEYIYSIALYYIYTIYYYSYSYNYTEAIYNLPASHLLQNPVLQKVVKIKQAARKKLLRPILHEIALVQGQLPAYIAWGDCRRL